MASSKTGSCSACGYSPVAYTAACCPRCGAQNTRPSLADRIVGRGMLIGLGSGILLGAAVGWMSDRPAAVVAYGLLGAIPGLIAGLFLGLVATVFADLVGKVSGRPPQTGSGGLVLPDPGEVRYCGHCRRQQSASAGIDCLDCGRVTVIWETGREPEAVARRSWSAANREY